MAEDAETIDEAAATWFVVLRDDDATDADRARHAAWLAADPRHRTAWDRYAALWGTLDGLAPDMRTAGAKVIPLPARAPAGRPAWRGWKRLAAAAAIILMVGGGTWLAAPAGTIPGLFAGERTGVGERRVVALPDGSTVALDAGSALSVRFDGHRRRVVLHHGEGFFDIARNEARPFVVEAAGGRVTVVGTAFDVKRGEHDVAVAVARGIVEVMGAAGDPVRLHRGQAVRYAARTGSPTAAEAADIGAWRQGRLAFQGAPLRDVLGDLDRHRHGRIVLMDQSLAMRPVTGMFRTDRTDGALETIAGTLRLRLVRVTPLLVLVYGED